MKRIILFRYHHEFLRNKEFLKFFKYLNPEINIYGLYGGPVENYEESSEVLHKQLTHNYLLKVDNEEWKWKSSDIMYQLWYKDYGHQIDFDVMHVFEWDLLLFEPLEILYKQIPAESLGITGLIPIQIIQDKWYWTKHPPKKAEWEKLKVFFQKQFNYNQHSYGMLGPGICLPKSFLDKMKDILIPDLSNDEVRIPMYAQVLGYKLYDTGFYKKWFSRKEFKFFNANGITVQTKVIEKALKRNSGRRVFHPCNQNFSFEQLVYLYKLTHRKPQKNLFARLMNLNAQK